MTRCVIEGNGASDLSRERGRWRLLWRVGREIKLRAAKLVEGLVVLACVLAAALVCWCFGWVHMGWFWRANRDLGVGMASTGALFMLQRIWGALISAYSANGARPHAAGESSPCVLDEALGRVQLLVGQVALGMWVNLCLLAYSLAMPQLRRILTGWLMVDPPVADTFVNGLTIIFVAMTVGKEVYDRLEDARRGDDSRHEDSEDQAGGDCPDEEVETSEEEDEESQ